jgi:hypothetical protein
MSKMSRRMWVTISVVAALCISGGIIYAAYDEHLDGVKIDGRGIGMDGADPPMADGKISWYGIKYAPDVFIFGNDTGTMRYLEVSSEASSGRDSYVLLENYLQGDSAYAMVYAGMDDASIGTYDDSAMTEPFAEVKATLDGDVVITLGN